MFCPHTVIKSGGRLYICRHEKSDYHQGTPFLQRANPLRYEIGVGKGPGHYRKWNKDGWMARALSNFIFRLRHRHE